MYSKLFREIADNIDNTLDAVTKYLSTNSNNALSDVNDEITFIGDGSVLYKDLIMSKFTQQNLKLSFSLNQFLLHVLLHALIKILLLFLN